MASACSTYIVHLTNWVLCSWFALSSPSPALPMLIDPTSSRPGTGSHSELSHSSPALRTPPTDVQPDLDGVFLHNIHHHGQVPLEADHSLITDLGRLVHLAGRLRPSLPPGCRWLGQEDVRVTGTRPIDAGGFANVWVGEMDDLKVAVKSYRCYASTDHMPTYSVSYPQPSCILRSPTTSHRGFAVKP